MLAIVQHVLNIVLQAGCKILADFLVVACKKAQLGVVDVAVFPALVVIRFVIPEFQIAYPFADIPVQGCGLANINLILPIII